MRVTSRVCCALIGFPESLHVEGVGNTGQRGNNAILRLFSKECVCGGGGDWGHGYRLRGVCVLGGG